MVFDKFKQLRDLKSKASEVKGELSSVTATEEYKGWSFTMNGNQELINVKIDPDSLDPNETGRVEDIVKTGINKTIKATQKKAAKHMMNSGGLEGMNLPGM